MKKNILVTGSKGQLGSELRELSEEYQQYNFSFTSKSELDITQKPEVEDFLTSHRINVIINCAAYTAVDKAEEDFELADKINHTGVKHLAEIAKKAAIQLIHISTDYVFNGENFKPYGENDPTSPVNKYGQTKLAGEESIIEAKLNNSMIIRTSWVYSSYGNNFVKTMLKLGNERDELKVVNDQIGTPTYARDLAEFILKNCIEIEHHGLETYHYTNEGVCSWYDFAVEIMHL
ncbi:MAG: dTDP-4-dehydrorhamnose reductase, partial [Christiangramia sp.]|nr:dTDP-4-dehydrorhamnose reductase [Christiangramia sp.]